MMETIRFFDKKAQRVDIPTVVKDMKGIFNSYGEIERKQLWFK